MTEPLLGAIEAGGTKFICAIGDPSRRLIDETYIATGMPTETMRDVFSFFMTRKKKLAAIGIGSFGPLDMRAASPAYGRITSTPKLAWRNFDILGTVRKTLDVPVGFDTDVNAAVIAEAKWGAAKGHQTVLYVTVGTGIGGGAITEGVVLHGLVNPEMGHIRVPHDREKDPFVGSCPYHGDCLEGLASGTAMKARWGIEPSTFPPEHPAFYLEAEYISLACVNWICTLSPEKIILGGGVMQAHMFPLIRARTRFLLNGYLEAPEILGPIEHYIVPPSLGHRAGVLGALLLAARATGFIA
jgi:fructokinase